MTQVRYIADSMAEAVAAARRHHGSSARIVRAGARRGNGFLGRMSFEVVVDASARTIQARRAAREALANAVVAARLAAGEARSTLEGAANAAGPACAAAIARLGARLRAQALPEELVGNVLARVGAELDRAAVAEVDAIARTAAVQAVAALLPVSEAPAPSRTDAGGRPWVIAVAGPTGVGKTTTLAKLAAEWRLSRGLRVGFLAADAFRVGAVEQLRTYASIIGSPVRAADGPSAARDALAALASCDVVLVDTPGRGHRDAARIGELAEVLRAVAPDERCLVLPGTASSAALAQSVAAFGSVRPTRLVLSKLDESEGLGTLVGAVRASGAAASWFTTGQGVPDDIERADAAAFARRLVGEDPA